jgi:CRP-like cAMP-binding protein
MLQQLKNLDPFQMLDQDTLKTVAQHAQLIRVPAGRWVQAPGRRLRGRYYLLRGELKDTSSPRVLLPGAAPLQMARNGVVTLTASQLLRIDLEPIAFLFADLFADSEAQLQPDTRPLHKPALLLDRDSWQSRFLRSHLLSPLSALLWQQILRCLTPRECAAGECVIAAGERGSECFILAQGHALVTRTGVTLRALGPGDFFGEDALLAGAPRNADVHMTTAGSVMVLQQADFRRWLADVLVAGAGLDEPGISNQRCVPLQVRDARGLRDQLANLDACLRYRVTGPLPLARLAVFLLRQRGIRAELATAGQHLVRELAEQWRLTPEVPSGQNSTIFRPDA